MSKVGTEFLVNTQTANSQLLPSITSLTNGGFVITWQDSSGTLGDSDGTSIKAQVFDASGTKVGTEFLVNTNTASSQFIRTSPSLPTAALSSPGIPSPARGTATTASGRSCSVRRVPRLAPNFS